MVDYPRVDNLIKQISIYLLRMFAEFGCHPELVERDDQVKPALKRACDFAMREKKPAFIKVLVDANVLQGIWFIMTGTFSRYVKWNQLPEKGQRAILENGQVPRAMLPAGDVTWRAAILASEKQKKV